MVGEDDEDGEDGGSSKHTTHSPANGAGNESGLQMGQLRVRG